MRRKQSPQGRNRQPAPPRGKRRAPAPEDKRRESEDIERAVYDGMQDLRAEREKNR